ncbi:MAG TPA: formate dehydrogenase accessory sulfurtransferase FdhD [Thermoanaerobaculia bacterium]|jgi:FdhD protein|nr:formate dehydrogenase accessory sulfurtransferase FdhD [Thermoanaerobaculia bacterium]
MRPRAAKPSKTGTRVWRVGPEGVEERPDHLATEEPLEIRLVQEGRRRTVAVTMRTPGADAELALGFLFAEGVIAAREQVRRAAPCLDPKEGDACDNILEVELAEGVPAPELAGLDRHFFATSACGVCGKAGLEALRLRVSGPVAAGPEVAPEVLATLPVKLREAQGLFDVTGGLHAAGLFDAAGRLLAAREDVGRHNALDKLMGWALLQGLLPLAGHVVMVSGRSSYEILQKCMVAGVPIVCAVSAPSSLAVDLAERFGMTLVGFLRGDRFNVYSGPERIAGALPPGSPRRRERSVLRTV